MSELTRPLTVRFNTRTFLRLSHEELLTSNEEWVESSEIKALQLTENPCFVTVDTRGAKEKLLCDGLSIRGTFNNVFDVDKIVTHVTIRSILTKWCVLMHYMKSYGVVVEHSMKRGKIGECTNERGVCLFCEGEDYKQADCEENKASRVCSWNYRSSKKQLKVSQRGLKN